MSNSAPRQSGDAARIAQALTDAIERGIYPVGGLIPSELELCEQLQASRYAVREALAALSRLGWVERRKNRGTLVLASAPRRVFQAPLATLEDLVQFGATHERRIQRVARVTLDAGLAAELGGAAGSERVRVSSVRCSAEAAQAATAWTDVYLMPEDETVVALAQSQPQSLFSDLLQAQRGIVTHTVLQDVAAACITDSQVCEALAVKPGMAALRVVRRYVDLHGTVFLASVSLHPQGRYSIRTELRSVA